MLEGPTTVPRGSGKGVGDFGYLEAPTAYEPDLVIPSLDIDTTTDSSVIYNHDAVDYGLDLRVGGYGALNKFRWGAGCNRGAPGQCSLLLLLLGVRIKSFFASFSHTVQNAESVR